MASAACRRLAYGKRAVGGQQNLTLAGVVMFLNEEQLLPRMLASLEHQSRPLETVGARRRRVERSLRPPRCCVRWRACETRATMHGWHVHRRSFVHESPLQLRPTGPQDGVLRCYLCRGAAASGYGAHPLNVLASALVRMHRPRWYLQHAQVRRLKAPVRLGGAR
jgi:hypothetical protein